MKTISSDELKDIKKSLSFYDFDNHTSKNGRILVKFNNYHKITRFGDIRFGGLSQDFEFQANMTILATEVIYD